MGASNKLVLFACLFVLVAISQAELKRPCGIVSFGDNTNNRLGQGAGASATSGKVTTGCPNALGLGCTYSRLAVTGSFVAALTTQGDVYGWGNNNVGQLDPTGPSEVTPSRINDNYKAYGIVAYDGALVAVSRIADVISTGNISVLPTFDLRVVSIPLPPTSSPVPTSTPTPSPGTPAPTPVFPPTGTPSFTPPFGSPDAPLTIAPSAISPATIGTRKRAVAQSSMEEMMETVVGSIDTAMDTMACSATRCYFYNTTTIPPAWYFWGAAEYDAVVSTDLTKVPNSAAFAWMAPSRLNVVALQLGAGQTLWAQGRAIEALQDTLAPNMVDLTSYVGCADGKLAFGDNEFDQLWRAHSGDGFTIYVCRDQKAVYGWGVNSNRQLGNNSMPNPYYPGVTPHVKVDIPLDDNEVIWAIAAGFSTGYAFTSFNNTWGWGYAGQNALNDYVVLSVPFVTSPIPLWQSFNKTNNKYYQIRSIYASGSSHGLMAIMFMRWGNGCAILDTAMQMADTFCDPDGFLNLPDTMAMSGAGSALMNVYMKMRGNMQMNGTSIMTSLGGMEMEGDVALSETSRLTLGGANRLTGNLSLTDASTVVLTNVSLQIEGQAEFGTDTTLHIEKALQWIDSETPMIQLSGDVNLDGKVRLILTQEEVDELVSMILGNPSNPTPPETAPTASTPPVGTRRRDSNTNPDAPNDAPSSNSSTSGSASMNVMSTNGTARATGQVTVSAPLPSASCTTVTPELQATSSSLTVLFTVTSTPECGGPGNTKTPTQAAKANRTAGIIAGSIVGGVALLAILAAVIILKVKPIRRAILPYRDATAKRLARTPIVPAQASSAAQGVPLQESGIHQEPPSSDDEAISQGSSNSSYETSDAPLQ